MMNDSETNPLKDFDKNLQQLYYDVIRKEVDLQIMWKAHSIRRALSEVVKAYIKRPRRKSDIRFNTPYRRCAYLLKHGPCFTSAVAKYFNQLVRERNHLLDKAFKSGNLSICCLGGGPATDAVAVIYIIRSLYWPYWVKSRKTLKINVSVVDISEEWQETAKNVLELLRITPELFGHGQMALSYEFLSADLTLSMDKHLQTTIKSADIVTMIYFLSAVTGSRGRQTCEQMVEAILLQMKKEAFVFYLDSAVDKNYEILKKASEKRNVMQEIYGPFLEEFHTLSIESVKSFLSLYSKHFHRLICMTNAFFCVCSWQKPVKRETMKRIRREILMAPPSSIEKPSEEHSDNLTFKMKQYRSTVNRLVNKTSDSSFNLRSNEGARNKWINFGTSGKFDNEKHKYLKNFENIENRAESAKKNGSDNILNVNQNRLQNNAELSMKFQNNRECSRTIKV